MSLLSAVAWPKSEVAGCRVGAVWGGRVLLGESADTFRRRRRRRLLLSRPAWLVLATTRVSRCLLIYHPNLLYFLYLFHIPLSNLPMLLLLFVVVVFRGSGPGPFGIWVLPLPLRAVDKY